MRLHENIVDFRDLQELTAKYIGIPSVAIARDYYIVMMLQNLAQSPYYDTCVFKGGTSLSKCYPGSIERFSEDIDLTFIPQETLGNKQYDRHLKQIEKVVAGGFRIEKIEFERNNRNKSSYIWFNDKDTTNGRIKLEIGSSVRPDPYKPMAVKTYIQEYLESRQMFTEVKEFGLSQVIINTLSIERTFLDKVMSVKRHAICGTLLEKIRHVYDVTMLYSRKDIKQFLNNEMELKRLLELTKKTDAFYLEKRNLPDTYTPMGAYAFSSWCEKFDALARNKYEKLHEMLLYTDKKQDFDIAVRTFMEIDKIFASIGE
ncbi:MAG: nucleotidyl transferase AbiEii/AbiGii toxin family protein [Anaerovibrio sp.]|uniref:nucleotidyl transferase AbiEii/AbiGii toxin family protein n=1 Tax=Anaerovibrio sp. TaxID=1872532 RepID=UPI0025ECC360|nr:nucleotidyl transferase AbiEii/AbiGii toxin family protein [Anaerovibrio sp.]MCR5176927.1 nucleotidyl transferase AbiEii/AbiGii toxin family protein [Anaerovibrio sp.]